MGRYWEMVLNVYACVLLTFFSLERTERRYLFRHSLAELKHFNTLFNKILLFLLDECNISKGKKHTNYVYYAEKIGTGLMVIGIPWFLIAFLTEWYLTESFITWHLIASLCIALFPMLLLFALIIISQIKIRIYKRKTKFNESEKRF